MKARIIIAALLCGAFAAPAAAELWVEVERLPGDIPVELDAESVEEAMDGANLTLRGTFRKPLPNAMVETEVAIDCRNVTSKIRAVRMIVDGKVFSESITLDAPTKPVTFGTAEAIYLRGLCLSEIPPPPMPDVDPGALDEVLSEHAASQDPDDEDGPE